MKLNHTSQTRRTAFVSLRVSESISICNGSIKGLLIFFSILFVETNQKFNLINSRTSSFPAKCAKSNYSGTTNRLEDIFKGRCYEFLNVKHRDKCQFINRTYDCDKIWMAFSLAVLGKNPCDVKISDFSDYLSQTFHEIPANTNLFWSGTYEPSHASKIQNSQFNVLTHWFKLIFVYTILNKR